MLAALVYLADLETENFCGNYTRQAAEYGINIASGALPRHISLGTPHPVSDFAQYLRFTDAFASRLRPLHLTLNSLDAAQARAGTREVCWLGFHYLYSRELEGARRKTASALRLLHLALPDPDPIWNTRNLTLLTGTGDLALYRNYACSSPRTFAGKTVTFDKLGVFFYSGSAYGECPYFCCRRYPLSRTQTLLQEETNYVL